MPPTGVGLEGAGADLERAPCSRTWVAIGTHMPHCTHVGVYWCPVW
jgi:hypothetical protein